MRVEVRGEGGRYSDGVLDEIRGSMPHSTARMRADVERKDNGEAVDNKRGMHDSPLDLRLSCKRERALAPCTVLFSFSCMHCVPSYIRSAGCVATIEEVRRSNGRRDDAVWRNDCGDKEIHIAEGSGRGPTRNRDLPTVPFFHPLLFVDPHHQLFHCCLSTVM